MKRAIIILAILGGLLFAGALWLPQANDFADIAAPPVGRDGLPEPPLIELSDEPETELDAGMDRPEWPSGPGARRLVHVPAGNAPEQSTGSRYDDLRNIDESELEAFTDHNLDKALEGDLAAANRVVHAYRRCASAPKSLMQVENQVQQQQRRYQRWAERGGNRRGFPSANELREQLTRQFENCGFMDSMFTPDLRRQLEAMAERGEVTARYLYALWPPETFGRADAFLQQQEWAEKALAYTLANLTAGETAGLLAFGQSYANNGTFTARDRYLGTAFIIAALDCGLDLDYYANYVNSFLNSERFAGSADDPRDDVLVMADGLKGFCR